MEMNKKSRLLRIGIAALTALLLSGASVRMALAALSVPCSWTDAYLPALLASALCALAAWSTPALCAAAAAGVLGVAVLIGTRMNAFSQIGTLLSAALGHESGGAAAMPEAGALLAALAAAVLTAAYFVLVHRRGGTPFALLMLFAILIVSYALREDMSFAMAVPGLIAALAAFAFGTEVQRDAGAWRAAAAAVLAVAFALVMTPSGRVTWAPLEAAAERIRAAFEDYFRFTEERVPFTISTEGYNHAAEVGGSVVSQLGGPASPSTDPVMCVSAEADVLLRGSIRRTYTGSSWTDTDAKARYLYYDPTRTRVRERVFDEDENEAFAAVEASVEMIGEGTSTLFVPGRMGEFSMSLDTAAYYNSIGEMFLARRTQDGDAYSATGYIAADAERVRAAVIAVQNESDAYYAEMLDSCTQLPGGVEEGVYALAVQLTQGCDNAYDKAAAIQRWLRENCTYTLTPDYPEQGRDFVSEFVLDDREGYCSYFASAMTVMCRIAGLPARYIEGYSVKAGQNVIVTGEDAHAWTEVYFNGLGWVAFDPSTGSGSGGEQSEQGDSDVPPTDEPEAAGENTPAPEPDATPEPDDGQGDEPTPSPEPNGESGDATSPEPSDDPDADWPPDSEPSIEPEKPRSLRWFRTLLIVLLLLTLLALAAIWTKRRLEATDPIRLSARAETPQQAAMILYRSILTLLAQTGQGPVSGESPSAFARRIGAPDGDFAAFADAVAMSAYARAGVDRSAVKLGRSSYIAFEKALKKPERIRFALHRMFKGLGSFEVIP